VGLRPSGYGLGYSEAARLELTDPVFVKPPDTRPPFSVRDGIGS
jgi:hypothetical protein